MDQYSTTSVQCVPKLHVASVVGVQFLSTVLNLFMQFTERNKERQLPRLLELFNAQSDFFVVLALQSGVVGLCALQLSTQTGRRLGFLVQTSVQVVEINLEVRQRDAQLVTLLSQPTDYIPR